MRRVFGSSWYATYLWTEFGLKFVDEARQANKPFFLYLPFNAPHFPLMAPAELIARYRGKYKAGWDRMRQERYQRQVRMGLVDAKWPLSPREPDTPPWDSLSDQQKDRFDHQMAVYAAMIEAIDTAVGTLVKASRRAESSTTRSSCSCRTTAPTPSPARTAASTAILRVAPTRTSTWG